VQYVTQDESLSHQGFRADAAERRMRRRSASRAWSGDDRDEGRLTLRAIALAMLFALPMWGALGYCAQLIIRAL
jgi:hypothetical protein